MTFGSLFAGIGGFDLGFERAGLTPKWQVEIDPYCRRVLAKHWPDVRRYDDVRHVHAAGVCGSGNLCDGCLESVDVLCGGFPCQDISTAGKGSGITGARSGLWAEFARLIGELRPRYVVVENVSALLARGLGRVLGDLAACGYDAEWDCIPAAAVGAPHRRDRLWLVAYAGRGRVQSERAGGVGDGEARSPEGETPERQRLRAAPNHGREDVVEPDRARREHAGEGDARPWVFGEGQRINPAIASAGWWDVEPAVGRVAHGVSKRLDRLRGLGNAVVPQIPELIGRRLMDVVSIRRQG